MKRLSLENNHDSEETGLARRRFLKTILISGIATTGLSGTQIYGKPTQTLLVSESCNNTPAASLLSLFSGLAWKLPNKLDAAIEANRIQNLIYAQFDTRYKELVDLAQKLKINCAAYSSGDPRLQEILEIAETGQKNLKLLQTTSYDDKNIAYLHLVTLVAASQQIGRTANHLLPETDLLTNQDNQIICQMLGKVNQLQEIKKQMDEARKKFQEAFKGFVDTIGNLNKIILDASQKAARAERGETGAREALEKIGEAEKILTDLAKQSLATDADMITPQEFRLLIDVPKKILNKEIPLPPTQSYNQSEKHNFQSVSYDKNAAVSDAAYWKIVGIIRNYISPSDWFTSNFLALACFGVLQSYRDNPPRTRLVRNALQSLPYLSQDSKIGQATALIVKITF